jgi:hypothetical protein
MSKIKTGGPAFPIECNLVNGFRQDEGMTLRDHFASSAIGSVVRQCAADLSWNGMDMTPAQYFAMKAYEIADAMLAHKYETDPKPPSLDDDRPF